MGFGAISDNERVEGSSGGREVQEGSDSFGRLRTAANSKNSVSSRSQDLWLKRRGSLTS